MKLRLPLWHRPAHKCQFGRVHMIGHQPGIARRNAKTQRQHRARKIRDEVDLRRHVPALVLPARIARRFDIVSDFTGVSCCAPVGSSGVGFPAC